MMVHRIQSMPILVKNPGRIIGSKLQFDPTLVFVSIWRMNLQIRFHSNSISDKDWMIQILKIRFLCNLSLFSPANKQRNKTGAAEVRDSTRILHPGKSNTWHWTYVGPYPRLMTFVLLHFYWLECTLGFQQQSVPPTQNVKYFSTL